MKDGKTIIIVILIIIIAAGGWYYYQTQMQSDTQSETSSTPGTSVDVNATSNLPPGGMETGTY